MIWKLIISDGNNSPDETYVHELPVAAVKEFLTACIRCDKHDIDLFDDCFTLMDRIIDDPQDYYRIESGDIGERITLTLKPVNNR